jgi:hypothetical protein
MLGIVAALLAGCSGPQGGQTIPSNASESGVIAAPLHAEDTTHLLAGGLSPTSLLEFQLEGRLPAPVLPDVLRRQLQQQHVPRPHLAFNANATVGIWVSNTDFNYLIGQDASGTGTVTAIDGEQNGCYSPVAVKVDSARNLWVACELTSPSSTQGVLQEYGPAGKFRAAFSPKCPSNVANCKSFMGYGWDSAVTPQRIVFASLNLYSMQVCAASCTTALGAGFDWWPRGAGKNAKPKLISVGSNCAPICGVGFMDLDKSGNIWFDFAGYNSSNTYGFGLGEITNPTTDPVLKIVEPIGTYGFFGGIDISNKGTTLNVIDQKARTVSQYHLPLAVNGKPFNVLGPAQTTVFGVGTPVSGTFNQDDTKMAVGDSGGWIDLGVTATNTWVTKSNLNFYSGLEGAAFTPSDK